MELKDVSDTKLEQMPVSGSLVSRSYLGLDKSILYLAFARTHIENIPPLFYNSGLRYTQSLSPRSVLHNALWQLIFLIKILSETILSYTKAQGLENSFWGNSHPRLPLPWKLLYLISSQEREEEDFLMEEGCPNSTLGRTSSSFSPLVSWLFSVPSPSTCLFFFSRNNACIVALRNTAIQSWLRVRFSANKQHLPCSNFLSWAIL